MLVLLIYSCADHALRKARNRECFLHAFSTISMTMRSEEHTSELQSRLHLVCRLLLEKKKRRLVRESVSLGRKVRNCCRLNQTVLRVRRDFSSVYNVRGR